MAGAHRRKLRKLRKQVEPAHEALQDQSSLKGKVTAIKKSTTTNNKGLFIVDRSGQSITALENLQKKRQEWKDQEEEQKQQKKQQQQLATRRLDKSVHSQFSFTSKTKSTRLSAHGNEVEKKKGNQKKQSKRVVYDLWQQQPSFNQTSTESTSITSPVIKRTRIVGESKGKTVIGSGIAIAAEGSSYQPDINAHKVLLERIKRREQVKQRLLDKLNRRIYHIPKDPIKQPDQDEEEDDDEQNESIENIESDLEEEGKTGEITTKKQKQQEQEEQEEEKKSTKPVNKVKTEKERKVERKQRMEQAILRRKLQMERRNASVDRIPKLLRKIKSDERKHQKKIEKRHSERKKQIELKLNKEEILDNQEIPNTLRQLQPKGNILKDLMDSLNQRGLIEKTKKKQDRKIQKKYDRKYFIKRSHRDDDEE